MREVRGQNIQIMYKQGKLDVIWQSLCDSIAAKNDYDKAKNIIESLKKAGYIIESEKHFTIRDEFASRFLNAEINSFNNMSEENIIRYKMHLINKWGNLQFNDLLSKEAYQQADSMIKIR